MDAVSFDEIQNMICPMRTLPNNSKRDFLTNSLNNTMSIEDLIKKQAVNKIIRAYREYKLYKEEKLKYNTYMNGNDINFENFEDINDDEDNNDMKLKHKKNNDKEIRALVQFSNGVIVQGVTGEYNGNDSGDLFFYY